MSTLVKHAIASIVLAATCCSAFAATQTTTTNPGAQGHVATSADAQAIDAACKSDGATAGCGNAQVGTGLMKCIHAYKETHKDWKVSEGCKAAMQKAGTDRMAH